MLRSSCGTTRWSTLNGERSRSLIDTSTQQPGALLHREASRQVESDDGVRRFGDQGDRFCPQPVKLGESEAFAHASGLGNRLLRQS